MIERKEFLERVLKEAHDQIKSLLFEVQSNCSSAKESVNFVTSTRLKAKAKATAALKKGELQKYSMEVKSRSIPLIEEEDLALARRKGRENARLEAMSLDEEAARFTVTSFHQRVTSFQRRVTSFQRS